MILNDEERDIGKLNFAAAIGSQPVRRDFLMKQVTDQLASKKGLGAYYFGYGPSVDSPVRVGVLGTGDEGSVLIGALNPEFMTVVSIADIRPYNVWRAFNGDHSSETALDVRPGLKKVYGWKTDEAAHDKVKVYGDYNELIAHAKDDQVEAVIIALPLHLHAPAAIAAMNAGLHVITEKLMAHSVGECKQMARVAAAKAADMPEGQLYLAVGHQRHYNILYNNAVELIRQGVLGELHYIRAQWHRANLPGRDSWQVPMPRAAKPDDKLAGQLDTELAKLQKSLDNEREALAKDKDPTKHAKKIGDLETQIVQKQQQIADAVDATKFGYEDRTIGDYHRPAIEELIRWRLWDRTGGGLMAELGSHQLDAASIFIAAVHGGEKQMPLSVAAAANRPIFPADREIEDHVFCTLEFPAPGYDPKDPYNSRKKIGVQYASINGNGYGGYGEMVFGTSGTLSIETEKEAMLWRMADTTGKTRVREKKVRKDGKVIAFRELISADQGDIESSAIGQLATLQPDRGYAEELEHFAWCIRNPAPENQPRCGPKIALGDAVIALTTNIAARIGERVEFKHEWFDVDDPATPEEDLKVPGKAVESV